MGLQRLGISNPTANTNTTIYTATNQYLVSVIATNKSVINSEKISVWVEPSGASGASEYAYIVYDITLDAANSFETFRFAINQNDVVRIRASTADISFQVYGLVQYDVNLGVGISSYQATAPTDTVDGLIWIDSDAVAANGAKPAYVWDSSTSSWTQFVGGTDVPLQNTAPSSPNTGDLWIDNTDPAKPILKVYDGSAWVIAGSSVEADSDQIVIAQRMFMS